MRGRRRLELLEGSAVAACVLLGAPIAARLAAHPIDLAGADLTSGLVHWFCDRFFEEHTPVIGPVLIRPFPASGSRLCWGSRRDGARARSRTRSCSHSLPPSP